MSKPAARVTDMHVCPMVTGLVPHVGGPILPPGHPVALIAGLPAARLGDMAICTGPPDVIVMGSFTVLIGGKPAARMGDSCAHGGTIVAGCPTVLIGDSGGAGSPQAATMAAARAAGNAFVPTNCATNSAMSDTDNAPLFQAGDPARRSWIEIQLSDLAGQPVPYERYRVVAPDGTVFEGFLDVRGHARVSGIDAGTCQITFPNLDQDAFRPA